MLKTVSGAPVSRFSFGAMQFGGKADAAESALMYGACREHGINAFDTAFVYTEGRSETLLGDLVRPERDEIFLATKCAATGSAPDVIAAEFTESRQRLGMDQVDLLYLHRWDDAVPLEATFETLADFVNAGFVRHIGVSNFAAWQVMKAQGVAEKLGVAITVLQPMYNLVKRQAEVEILPMAQSEGLAVWPYSPLGGGLLTGKYARGEDGRLSTDQMYNARYGPEWMREAARDLTGLAGEVGAAPATLAVAWAARHPGVTGPIISARSAAQLVPSLDAISFEMDDDLYARISALTPAPPPATDRLEEAG